MRGKYMLSVKRTQRDHAPENWQDQVLAIPGVNLVGRKGGSILAVVAEDAAVKEILRQVGTFCHVETPVRHRYR
jgi:hypothetical protein